MEPQSANTGSENIQSDFSNTSAESLSRPESIADNVEQGPAPQETDKLSRESVNQNAGMTLPQVVTPTVGDGSQVAPVSNQTPIPIPDPANPSMADDVDVVEKEWVDRARHIVEQTRDDPYRQEEEVEKLQMDYIKKRYGRDVKASNDN